MARISSRLPSSRATEINLQSRYPGGMLVRKIEYHCWLLVLAPTALAVMAAFLSVGRGLVFCARALWLATTTAIVRAEAIMRIAKKFFVFIFCCWMTDFFDPAAQECSGRTNGSLTIQRRRLFGTK